MFAFPPMLASSRTPLEHRTRERGTSSPRNLSARVYVNGVPLHMKGVNWNPVGIGGYHPHGAEQRKWDVWLNVVGCWDVCFLRVSSDSSGQWFTDWISFRSSWHVLTIGSNGHFWCWWVGSWLNSCDLRRCCALRQKGSSKTVSKTLNESYDSSGMNTTWPENRQEMFLATR